MKRANARVRLQVRGRVQGVWYRDSTREQASTAGLVGWVRNLPDGTVEAVAEGPRDALERLVTWCQQGPPSARVTSVEAEWSETEGGLEGFAVRH